VPNDLASTGGCRFFWKLNPLLPIEIALRRSPARRSRQITCPGSGALWPGGQQSTDQAAFRKLHFDLNAIPINFQKQEFISADPILKPGALRMFGQK
jgi:hypothetical protein